MTKKSLQDAPRQRDVAPLRRRIEALEKDSKERKRQIALLFKVVISAQRALVRLPTNSDKGDKVLFVLESQVNDCIRTFRGR